MCSSSYYLGPTGFYRDCVAAEIAERTVSADLDATECRFPDVHIASSCLQKALRRGDLTFALAAARMLLRVDPERLWRRLCVCAFEEFGLVDVGSTARVLAVAGSKAFRLVQGEERVLTYLIERLCALPKDRRLDDLYALGEEVFARPEHLRVLEEGPLGSVVAPLVHETARLIRTCERAVPRRSFRALSSESCERALMRMQRDELVDDGLLELCTRGVRQSRCLLPVLLPIAIEPTEVCGGLGEVSTNSLPSVPLIGGVPAYAFDGFTRSGRAVLARFAGQEPRLRLLFAHLSAKERLSAVTYLLFFAEGGQTSPEIRDPLSDALKLEAMVCGTQLPHEQIADALALMAELLPTVHALREVIAPRFPSPNQQEDLS